MGPLPEAKLGEVGGRQGRQTPSSVCASFRRNDLVTQRDTKRGAWIHACVCVHILPQNLEDQLKPRATEAPSPDFQTKCSRARQVPFIFIVPEDGGRDVIAVLTEDLCAPGSQKEMLGSKGGAPGAQVSSKDPGSHCQLWMKERHPHSHVLGSTGHTGQYVCWLAFNCQLDAI